MTTTFALDRSAPCPEDVDGEPLDDEELARLALAADPDVVVPVDAVPIRSAPRSSAGFVADWYMPAPEIGPGRSCSRRRRLVVLVIISAFLVINAYGLCSTYGLVSIA